MNLGFLASHNGSNMQAVIDACKSGKIAANPVVVISNNKESKALQRAVVEGIAAYHINVKTEGSEDHADIAICSMLEKHAVDLVVLAGYMKKIGKAILERFSDKIINIHPALLPKHGGQGMYGNFVHQAVLTAGEKESGATIHLVNEEYDRGRILAQARVPVETNDTVETLAKRVLSAEHELYVDTISKIASGDLKLSR